MGDGAGEGVVAGVAVLMGTAVAVAGGGEDVPVTLGFGLTLGGGEDVPVTLGFGLTLGGGDPVTTACGPLGRPPSMPKGAAKAVGVLLCCDSASGSIRNRADKMRMTRRLSIGSLSVARVRSP